MAGMERDRWLIPGALGFLALAVVFAVVMVTVPSGGGRSVPVTRPAAAGTPTVAASATTAPSVSPSPGPVSNVDGLLVHNVATGMCLGIGDGDPEGAVAQQEPCGDAPAERWRETPADGAVLLVNVASGKCLDVNNRETDDGARIQQWSCNNGANQQWRPHAVTTDPAGPVLLINANSNKCLEVPDGATDAGVPVRQRNCDGGPAQQWVAGG
jgi:Ricin-type beta-trefoil lectin domain